MKRSSDKQLTKARAVAFDRFMSDCSKRGLRVAVLYEDLYDPDSARNVPFLRVRVRSTDTTDRDPINLEERVVGDIRDTIVTLGLKIGAAAA